MLEAVSSPRLTETAYIVLGLLERAQPATAYDLKALAALSTANFWSLPHTQLYAECARLTQAGLLCEHQEQTGRRRRVYRLTESGRAALCEWLQAPTERGYELRDAATLKLFFGGDPAQLAQAQLTTHSQRLESYEELRSSLKDAPHGWLLALEAGIGHEREFIRFWSALGDQSSTPDH
jgi:DNA-binding PadR family transcriptional regulator